MFQAVFCGEIPWNIGLDSIGQRCRRWVPPIYPLEICCITMDDGPCFHEFSHGKWWFQPCQNGHWSQILRSIAFRSPLISTCQEPPTSFRRAGRAEASGNWKGGSLRELEHLGTSWHLWGILKIKSNWRSLDFRSIDPGFGMLPIDP